MLICVPWLLAIGGCRVEVGGAEQSWRDDEASAPSGLALRGEVRAGCLPATPLEPLRSVAIPEPVDRILPAEGTGGLLAVMESGLWRWNGAAWAPVLEGGRDYTLRADTIMRLAGKNVEFFRLRAGSAPRLVRSVRATGHDASIAVTGDAILLHSVANRNNHLLTRRAIDDGRVEGQWVPVERDFGYLFMNDFDTLLRDAGFVRAAGDRVAFVPLFDNPIRLFHADSLTAVELSTPSRGRGRVVTVARKIVRDEQACAGCRREVHELTSQRFQRIHADATFAGGSLWVLGSEVPGSPRALVHRFPLDSLRGSAVEAFRLDGLTTPPRALAVAGRFLVVASEDRLYWFARPHNLEEVQERNHLQKIQGRGRGPGGGDCGDTA